MLDIGDLLAQGRSLISHLFQACSKLTKNRTKTSSDFSIQGPFCFPIKRTESKTELTQPVCKYWKSLLDRD